MKKIAISCAAIAMVSSAQLQAAPKKPDPKPQADKSHQEDSKRQSDRSQGSFHANVEAIANVCGKDNPAAQRSALCTPKPISPG